MTDLPTGDRDRRNHPGNVLSKLKVFRFEFTRDVAEVYSEMNEVHNTGRMVAVYDQYTILASARSIAEAAFAEHTRYSKNVKIVDVIESQIDLALFEARN